MSNQEHIVAVVDTTTDVEPTLELARETVRRGGMATLVVLLPTNDRRGVRAFADSERLSIGDAEEIYFNQVRDAYAAGIGSAGTKVIVRYRPSNAHDVLATAGRVQATAMSVPASLVRHRKWRSALPNMPLSVYVTPVKRAA